MTRPHQPVSRSGSNSISRINRAIGEITARVSALESQASTSPPSQSGMDVLRQSVEDLNRLVEQVRGEGTQNSTLSLQTLSDSLSSLSGHVALLPDSTALTSSISTCEQSIRNDVRELLIRQAKGRCLAAIEEKRFPSARLELNNITGDIIPGRGFVFNGSQETVIPEIVRERYGTGTTFDASRFLQLNNFGRHAYYIIQVFLIYRSLFNIMEEKGHLNNHELLMLAYGIKALISPNNCPEDTKTSGISLLERFPQLVKDIIFQSYNPLHIMSKHYGGGLCSLLSFDGDRNEVFRPGFLESKCNNDWKFEPQRYDDAKSFLPFFIKNKPFNQYLYAGDYGTFDDDRRRVFTWKPGVPVAQGYFKIIPHDNWQSVKLINTHHNEYLYAAEFGDYSVYPCRHLQCRHVSFTYHRIFTWRPKSDPGEQAVWKLSIEKPLIMLCFYLINARYGEKYLDSSPNNSNIACGKWVHCSSNPPDNHPNVRWAIRTLTEGWCHLINKANGYYLDCSHVDSNYGASGKRVHATPNGDATAIQWKINEVIGTRYITLFNRRHEKYLDCSHENSEIASRKWVHASSVISGTSSASEIQAATQILWEKRSTI